MKIGDTIYDTDSWEEWVITDNDIDTGYLKVRRKAFVRANIPGEADIIHTSEVDGIHLKHMPHVSPVVAIAKCNQDD